jgi:hypothetical protein
MTLERQKARLRCAIYTRVSSDAGLRLAGDFGRRTAKTVGIRFADCDMPR